MRWFDAVWVGLIVGLWAGGVGALDAIEIPGGTAAREMAVVEAGGGVECPRLTRIKYPFVRCYVDDYGSLQLDTRGGPSFARSIPRQLPFVEGDGYWGAEPAR